MVFILPTYNESSLPTGSPCMLCGSSFLLPATHTKPFSLSNVNRGNKTVGVLIGEKSR